MNKVLKEIKHWGDVFGYIGIILGISALFAFIPVFIFNDIKWFGMSFVMGVAILGMIGLWTEMEKIEHEIKKGDEK